MSWISKDGIEAIVADMQEHSHDLPDSIGRGPRPARAVANQMPAQVRTVVIVMESAVVAQATNSPFLRRAQPRNVVPASPVPIATAAR